LDGYETNETNETSVRLFARNIARIARNIARNITRCTGIYLEYY